MTAPLRAALLAAALLPIAFLPAHAPADPGALPDHPEEITLDPTAHTAPPPAAADRDAATLLALAGAAFALSATLWAISIEPARERDAAARAWLDAPHGSRAETIAAAQFEEANTDADIARISSLTLLGLALALTGAAAWRW